MNNSNIRQLEDDIIALLNNSPVDMEVKRLIIADVMHLVTAKSDKVIMSELNEVKQNAEST